MRERAEASHFAKAVTVFPKEEEGDVQPSDMTREGEGCITHFGAKRGRRRREIWLI